MPIYRDNLSIFVGELRDLLFSSQEETAAYFYLDRAQISRYETGKSKPKSGYLAALAQLISTRSEDDPKIQEQLLRELNRAIPRHYRKSKFRDWPSLNQAADDYLLAQRDRQAKRGDSQATPEKDNWQATLDRRTNLLPPVELIGVKGQLVELLEVLMGPEGPWLISIEGLGGIGKTALANTLMRQPEMPDRFHDIAWVSAKQQSFLPGLGLKEEPTPALNIDTLTDTLLEQLGNSVLLAQSYSKKRTALTELLKSAPFLIVVDNLETMIDYQVLLPTLLKLANPSKFLLTSRHSLRAHPDIFCLGLNELGQADTIRFIRQEAGDRGISDVVNAPKSQLTNLYKVVGGNPLALKLVVGQMSVLSLPQVLDNLKQAQGKTIDELYTYIYWQAWQILEAATRQVFLMMPLAQGGTTGQLMELTKLEISELNQALQQLAKLSLVQVGGTLAERRYSIHRLTETFLLNEAIKWQSSA